MKSENLIIIPLMDLVNLQKYDPRNNDQQQDNLFEFEDEDSGSSRFAKAARQQGRNIEIYAQQDFSTNQNFQYNDQRTNKQFFLYRGQIADDNGNSNIYQLRLTSWFDNQKLKILQELGVGDNQVEFIFDLEQNSINDQLFLFLRVALIEENQSYVQNPYAFLVKQLESDVNLNKIKIFQAYKSILFNILKDAKTIGKTDLVQDSKDYHNQTEYKKKLILQYSILEKTIIMDQIKQVERRIIRLVSNKFTEFFANL